MKDDVRKKVSNFQPREVDHESSGCIDAQKTPQF